MIDRLPDEVWHRLDPHAGRLSRRHTRLVAVAMIGAVVLAAAIAVVTSGGLIRPRLADADRWGAYGRGWHTATGEVHHLVHLRNEGLVPVTVVGMGRSGPGFELRQVHAEFPFSIEPGEYVEVEVVYAVTDCAAVPQGPWPMPVRVRRPWGVQTVHIDMPVNQSAPDDPRLQWQQLLAEGVCRPAPAAPASATAGPPSPGAG